MYIILFCFDMVSNVYILNIPCKLYVINIPYRNRVCSYCFQTHRSMCTAFVMFRFMHRRYRWPVCESTHWDISHLWRMIQEEALWQSMDTRAQKMVSSKYYENSHLSISYRGIEPTIPGLREYETNVLTTGLLIFYVDRLYCIGKHVYSCS